MERKRNFEHWHQSSLQKGQFLQTHLCREKGEENEENLVNAVLCFPPASSCASMRQQTIRSPRWTRHIILLPQHGGESFRHCLLLSGKAQIRLCWVLGGCGSTLMEMEGNWK